MNQKDYYSEKLTTSRLMVLHLAPGALIVALYIFISPIVKAFGYPSLMSLMIAFLLVILPLELGFLMNMARTKTGSFFQLNSILGNEPLPSKQIFLYTLLSIIAIILVAGIMQFFDHSIRQTISPMLPAWYWFDEEWKTGYSQQALMVTAIFRIIIDGLIIPITEELYFRGYLLPRVKNDGILVPLVASLLFAVYHFWQPWNYPSLLLISAVLVFSAWKFKTYKISLYTHCFVNLLGSILFLLQLNVL